MTRPNRASLRVERLTGDQLVAALPDVARLRIEVFRDWPYLYDGDLAYEEAYLQPYKHSADAILVGAWDGEQLVGAATGTPMTDHAEDFAKALERAGLDPARTFYCAESVLQADYRGQGAGHAFFDLREAHARSLGLAHSAFASVVRQTDHPRRPETYRTLDAFWRKRGYAPVPSAIAHYTWKDLDDDAETVHDLQLWMRDL